MIVFIILDLIIHIYFCSTKVKMPIFTATHSSVKKYVFVLNSIILSYNKINELDSQLMINFFN